jgi:hypothetical protein
MLVSNIGLFCYPIRLIYHVALCEFKEYFYFQDCHGPHMVVLVQHQKGGVLSVIDDTFPLFTYRICGVRDVIVDDRVKVHQVVYRLQRGEFFLFLFFYYGHCNLHGNINKLGC